MASKKVDVSAVATPAASPGSAIQRTPDGSELIRINEITEAIDRLTEGRSKALPELSILAFDILQSIITGQRVDTFKAVYANTRMAARTMVLRHVHLAAGRSILGADSKLAPAPITPAAIEALRRALSDEDPRFRALADADLSYAIEAARAGKAENLPTICAHLSLACGAFNDVQKPGEEFVGALTNARVAFYNASRPPVTPAEREARRIKRKKTAPKKRETKPKKR